MSEEQLHDLAGAYVLDALDDLERRRYEEHLRGCDRCREEVAGFAEAATLLTDDLAVTPPADVRQRVMERVRAEPQAGSQAPDEQQAPLTPAPHRPSRSRWWLAAAAAAVVAAAGLTYAVTRPDDPVTTLMAQVLDAEDAQVSTEQAAGATFTVVSSDDVGRAVFMVDDLPQPPEGSDYQLWFVLDDGRAVSAGLVPPDGTPDARMLLEGSIPDAEETLVGVTVEPAGGSEQPTTEPIVAVPLEG